MNLPRIFANAFARKIAAVVVAMVLAWIGIGQARAQDYSNCNGTYPYAARCPDRPTAYAAAKASAQRLCDNTGKCLSVFFGGLSIDDGVYYAFSYRFGSGSSTANGNMRYWASGCPSGKEWNNFTLECQTSCSSRPTRTISSNAMIPNGSVGCTNGCEVAYFSNGDGTFQIAPVGGPGSMCSVLPKDCAAIGMSMNYGLSLCQPPVVECDKSQIKDPLTGMCTNGCSAGLVMDAMGVCKPEVKECPPGNVKSPLGACLPGDGQCAAGEARRKDGTCGKDADGDGEADIDDDDPDNDDEKESFSGGDNCNAPPSCSGGPIDCGMARIQWRIECNTRRNVNISGGTCGAMPICTGDNCKAMEYAQLIQQWKATCALEKLASREAAEGGALGDANGNGVADALEGRFTPSTGGTGDDSTGVGSFGINTGMLSQENIFGGGSCPQPPTFELMGQTISGADFPHWCNAMAILRALILIFGAFTALKILMGGVF